MKTLHHYVDTRDGWLVSLHQTWNPAKLRPHRRPVLIVPGYGMNSFIFQFHPKGLSLEGFLAESGFEVWRLDMRGQGGALRTTGKKTFGFHEMALNDLSVALDAVAERTRTDTDGRIDVIGASLGGTIMFTHAVLKPRNRLGTLVCMGSPVRWVDIHAAIRLAFLSPLLVGLVRVRGTRKAAEILVPRILRHVPKLLSIYMNPELVEEDALGDMIRTVEDPNHGVNKEIARWFRTRDLIVDGVNVAEGLRRLENPLLAVLATGDGIVPRATAAFAYHQSGAREKKLVEVGDRDIEMAHADLFVSREVHLRVFRPIADWLAQHADAKLAATGDTGP